MQGLLAIDDGFSLQLEGEAVRDRRLLDASAIAVLKDFTERYSELLDTANPETDLLALGRELYAWLDGDNGQLQAFLQRAARPLRFEVCTARREPTAAEWTLLRAPWELLADSQSFLAGDVGLGFSPVRRLGRRGDALALSDYRLGLAFMAASPQGIVDLDYEAEEAAIIEVIEAGKLDLLVEESGNPQELGERLAEYPPMQVVHLSCHGLNAWRAPESPDDDSRPVLFLETLEGAEMPTDAAALINALGAHTPRFIFLSACLTAAASGEDSEGLPRDGKKSARRKTVAHSLTEALVDAGVPAALGWNGSVADAAATAFAARLYDELADEADLADAVALARRNLLNNDNPVCRRDWHLARLWLGPQGGGRLVGGRARRAMMPATHGSKEFLIKEQRQAPVASHEMFVGRRRELQEALQTLEAKGHAGVLLTGMGRLGKSSLASRIANRRRDLRLAVVFGQYDAPAVLAALSEALKDNPKARDLLQAGRQSVGQRPERLADILNDLLRGPCAQGDGGTPVLLVIDDLDQVLVADPGGGRHRLVPDQAPVLTAVIQAFDAGLRHGPSRLVVTSRYRFTLGGSEARLHELPLPPLSTAAQSKLELRQREAAADAGLSGEALEPREALLARVPGASRGNPGLQDLLGRRLVLSDTVPVERAEQALTEMEAWCNQGDLPSDPEIRNFLKQLGVDELIDLAGAAERATLRRLTLFNLPVPQSVMEVLTAKESASQARLRDLGLIEPFEDLVDASNPAFAVNALAAGRLMPLSDIEQQDVAQSVTQALLGAWGGQDGDMRPYSCDLELTRLGILAEDSDCIIACATDALIAADDGPAANIVVLGQAAIDLLDAHGREVPWRLLRETAAALIRSGQGAAADDLLARGMAVLEEQRRTGADVDAEAAIFVVYEQALRLMHRGELDRAQHLFDEAVRVAREVGDERSASIARGATANILVRRGDLDGALRIRQEEKLVYERIGDIRSRAVAMAQIADILHERGDLDEALRIRLEVQPVYERTGDVRLSAINMGQIACIFQERGDWDEAMRIRREQELPVYEWLGDVRMQAIALSQIGNIEAAQGRLDEAIARHEQACEIIAPLGAIADLAIFRGAMASVLRRLGNLDEALRIRREEELPVYERLGDMRACAITLDEIADLFQERGDLDEALRVRREEELPLYERLGDIHSRAVTIGQIADILQAGGYLDEALRIRREEELPAYQQLGDEQSHAVTLGQIAELLQASGQLDEALRIRREEELPAYERLGDARARAVTLGQISDLLQARGDLDDALRIRQEELPIYQQLGDEQSYAVTMGEIADILEKRGDYNEALGLRQEQLPIYERLGEVRGCAVVVRHIGHIHAVQGRFDKAIAHYERASEIIAPLDSPYDEAVFRGSIADILHQRGDLDEARRIRLEEELPVFERLGAVRDHAVTLRKIGDIDAAQERFDEAIAHYEKACSLIAPLDAAYDLAVFRGCIAGVLQQRGQLDEALRIRREEELPVYEQLGELRARTIAMGHIAAIHEARGESTEALRIRREEEVPVFERLGDVRSRAIAMGHIADILEERGEVDEALRIRREEELPVYEQLGDLRARAVTRDQIADTLHARGDLAEALRIRREEELPAYEQLGDLRARAVTLGQIANILEERGEAEEALRVRREEELPAYEQLGDLRACAVTLGQIADILEERGEAEEALRVRREEELPVYERLGDDDSRATTMGSIADILTNKGDLAAARALQEERLKICRRLSDAAQTAPALWSLARLDLLEENFDDALPRLTEAYDIEMTLGRAEGIEAVGILLARTLAVEGESAKAGEVLRRNAEMFRSLGHEEGAQQADELLRELTLR